jgi:DNA-binding YbaB/EbfC family protein
MFDMFSMMNKVKEAQEKMKTTQENLVHLITTSESGAGMVKATINGHRQLLKLEIDPSIANDIEMVQDLTIAAVNKASVDIENLIKEEMKRSMEGMLPNIPGIDLNAFMK